MARAVVYFLLESAPSPASEFAYWHPQGLGEMCGKGYLSVPIYQCDVAVVLGQIL